MKQKLLKPMLSAVELADLCGLSGRRICQLAADGKLVRAGTQFPATENLKRLFLHFREFSTEYQKERTLKLAAQRRLAERELERADAGSISIAEHNRILAMIAMTEWPKRRTFNERILPQALNQKCQELGVADDTRAALVECLTAQAIAFTDQLETEAERLATTQTANSI